MGREGWCRRQERQWEEQELYETDTLPPEPREKEGSGDVRVAGFVSVKGLGNCIFLRINRYFLRKVQPQSGPPETRKDDVCKCSLSRVPLVSQWPNQHRVDCVSVPVHIAV